MDEANEPRFFAVDSAGVVIDVMELAGEQVTAAAETMLTFERLDISDQHIDALIEAAEIMQADDVPDATIGQLLVGCHKSGKDPVAFARHFVKLRKAIR